MSVCTKVWATTVAIPRAAATGVSASQTVRVLLRIMQPWLAFRVPDPLLCLGFMARELKGRRAATEEARKILRQQIDKGLGHLASRRVSEDGIHSARKQITRARATLRLLRPGLTRKKYRAENHRLRDAAKPLSAARDAAVLRKAIQKLQTGAFEADRMLANEQLRAHRDIAGGRPINHSRRLLRQARARASGWHLGDHGWSTIGAGLRVVYRQGRKALKRANREPSDRALHEWRKQVKYLRYQVQLLQPLWRRPLVALERELHTLSDCLGDAHDLAVLREKLTVQGSSLQRGLLAKLDRQRVRLQRKALQVGVRIYAKTPGMFVTRFTV